MGSSLSNSLENGGVPQGTISFKINGQVYTVDPERDKIGPQHRLVDFIRDHAGLKGTKYMCREGGCGACVVSSRSTTSSGDTVVKAVNSCLIPVLSCDGMEITTVEKVGNGKDGYHDIQKRLVNFGGTQCGFCTPGQIMNMFSLMESKKDKLRVEQIENSFDGNICRCTGYRPILDAFKSFASDAPDDLVKKCQDIEELGVPCPLKDTSSEYLEQITIPPRGDVLLSTPGDATWVKVTSLEKAFEAFEKFKAEGTRPRIISGNTGSGVFKKDLDGFKAFIDIGNVEELKKVETGAGNLVLGGAVTLTKAIKTFKKASEIPGFEYCLQLSKHIQRVANLPVRNVGTVAGNLMLKRNHGEFPSDLFTIFETVGAQLSIAESPTLLDLHTLTEFLKMDMANKIIVSIHFKPYSNDYVFKSFKITRRFQNAHAYINAGFLLKVDSNCNVVEKPRIVFGGVNNDFTHARNLETFLTSRSLKDSSILQQAFATLSNELNPDERPEDGSVEYRKLLPQSLFYKVVLSIVGDGARPEFRIGATSIKRNVTKGSQVYDTDQKTWPINKPVLKLESYPQVSGSAEYINDLDPQFGELFGAFVVSKVAKADIKGVDPSEAFKVPGVVRFIQASDIPGTNNYMIFYGTVDEVFASKSVSYAGQAIGLILADNQLSAFEGAKKVRVEYANVEKGILSISEGIKRAESEGRYDKLFTQGSVKSSQVFPDGVQKRVIKGEFAVGSQYHFQMETQIAICRPREDGMDVYSSTQWVDLIQASVASALNMPNNEIIIQVRRLGGAFGSKISRCSQIATACAVAAHVTNKPVRVALDLETNMEMIGKRNPYLMKYEIGVEEKTGKIVSLTGGVFSDPGISANEETASEFFLYFQSMYKAVGWDLKRSDILTNTAPNTWCRAPGSTPGIGMMENLMEHIAFELNLDPLQVKLANMIGEGDKLVSANGQEKTLTGDILIPRMIEELKQSGNVEQRKQFNETFNKNNRWRKRGMAIVPLRYGLQYGNMRYPAYVAIYKNDGTVVVSHGGIESGQGINTKVAQAVAFELEIPMEKVRVIPTYNFLSPNSSTTGASLTSEACCYAALQACKNLKERIAPIKEKFQPKTWFELIQLCHKNHIRLNASYMSTENDGLKDYHIWVLNLTEVEIDVLTGEHKIVRVDIIEDAGKSLNPAIDVGQIEGAVVMGIGYWTTEKIIYDQQTGQVLSNNTWLYKPPLPKDIPEDLRVTLLKDAPNPLGILRSKATGEPPQCSSVAVLFALKNAIFAARKDAGHPEWFQLDGPVTVEDIMLKCLNSPAQFQL